jgi:hypothetical protein
MSVISVVCMVSEWCESHVRKVTCSTRSYITFPTPNSYPSTQPKYSSPDYTVHYLFYSTSACFRVFSTRHFSAKPAPNYTSGYCLDTWQFRVFCDESGSSLNHGRCHGAGNYSSMSNTTVTGILYCLIWFCRFWTSFCKKRCSHWAGVKCFCVAVFTVSCRGLFDVGFLGGWERVARFCCVTGIKLVSSTLKTRKAFVGLEVFCSQGGGGWEKTFDWRLRTSECRCWWFQDCQIVLFQKSWPTSA